MENVFLRTFSLCSIFTHAANSTHRFTLSDEQFLAHQHLGDRRKRGPPLRSNVVQRRRRSRHLQTCVPDETFDNFVSTSLGPADADDSLYHNIPYPGDDPESFIDMPTLVDETVYVLYYRPTTPTFVQEEQYFGHDGRYTAEILNQHALLQTFWKTNEEGRPTILVLGLHSEPLGTAGSNLLEEALYEHLIYTEGYEEDVYLESVDSLASDIRLAIETEVPDNYANAALTIDLVYFVYDFGITGFEDSSIIVLGDGTWDYAASVGLDEIGNDFVHAHEFSHALQYILDLQDNNGSVSQYEQNDPYTSSPEASRRVELEADAMAAYGLAHEQGRNLELPLLLDAARKSFLLGDCQVDELFHHGTPLQRECATLWGADEGLDMMGDPVSMRAFRELFNDSYQSILDLDPAVCSLSEPITGGNSSSVPSPAATITDAPGDSATPAPSIPTNAPPPSAAATPTPEAPVSPTSGAQPFRPWCSLFNVVMLTTATLIAILHMV